MSGREVLGRVVFREERWGGLLLDQRHDRVWGAADPHFACIRSAFSGGAGPRGDEDEPSRQARQFVERYGPGAPGDANPYHLETFFFGDLPAEPDFQLEAPISVSWCITNRCQSACTYCCTESHPGAHDGLSPEDTLRVVDSLADWGALRLIIGGGEPLLRPDLPRVLERAAERGLAPTLATNGLLLPEADISVLSQTLMLAQVSLDSLDDQVYARLRGTRNGVSRVRQGLARLVAAGVPVRVVTVLSRGNEREIEAIADYLAALGVGQWFVFVVQRSGRARRRFDRHFPSDLDGCVDRLAEVSARHADLSVSIWGTSSDDQLAVYVTSHGKLELHDYGSGESRSLASMAGASQEDLARLWRQVDRRAQLTTLRNFTSPTRRPAALARRGAA
jgi:organic radical activating enzyme